jgi:thiol-disulfide isomerase/thioredoxin
LKAKEWCLFCLSVQLLLLLGGINITVNYLNYSNPLNLLNALNYQTIITALLLYVLPIVSWYSIKPVVLRLQTAKQTKREYLRLKFNSEIFNTLLQKQKTVDLSLVEGLGIDMGNHNAQHTLIKVCNPYCGPCAGAHPKIEKLLEENKNVKAKIIFTATAKEDDYRNKPVKHLLAIAAKNNEQLTRQALDDWYLAEKKDYDVFANKYNDTPPLEGQGEAEIAAMEKWCKEVDIQFTPTIFIGISSLNFPPSGGRGAVLYQMPDAYSIEDLQYFLLE